MLTKYPTVSHLFKRLLALLLLASQLAIPLGAAAQPPNPPGPPHDPGPPPMDFRPPANADSLEDFLPPGVQLRHFDTPPGQKIKAQLDRGRGDGLAYANDKVAVIMERNSVPNRSDLDFTLVATTPLTTTTTSAPTTRATTTITNTEVISQPLDSHIFYRFDIELTENDQPGPELDKQVRIVVDLRDLTADINPLYDNYFLAYWDEEAQAWQHVATTVYQDDGLISAEVPHFSEWAAGVLPERWQPSWVPPDVSTFSGAATYSYSFNIPPGRNGMQPDMSLSYSSRAIDGRILNREEAAIGDGWSLAEISVVRVGVKVDFLNNGSTAGTLHPDNFRLVFNGAGHRLIPSDINATGNNTVRYYVENAPGFQVYRYYDTSIGNVDGLYWIVDAPNGTRYRLGFTADSVEWNEVGASWQISEQGHAGERWQTAVFAWHVDTVTDTHGNRMQYDYYTKSVTESEPFTMTTQKNRLARISYNYAERYSGALPVPINTARFATTPGSKIEFLPANTDRINKIAIYHGGGSTATREYLLNVGTFTDASDVDPNATVDGDNKRCARRTVPRTTTNYVLNSITEQVGTTTLPPTTFTYSPQPHYNYGGTNCFRFRYLTTVDNGYGGRVSFTYASDNRSEGSYLYKAGTDSTQYPNIGFTYYVTEKWTNDGRNAAVKTGYSYTQPCYSQTNPTTGLVLCPEPAPPGGSASTSEKYGTIAGFATTTVRHYDYNASTVLSAEVTTFSQNAYPAVGSSVGSLGQPMQAERYSGDKALLLQTVETSYITQLVDADGVAPHSQAQFTAVRTVTTREKSSSSPELSHKVLYDYNTSTGNSVGNQNGNQYGNVTLIAEYDSAAASTPYRTTLRWFKPNTTNWVVDKVAYEVVYEGATWTTSSTKRETRYFYDGQTNHTSTPTKGDMTEMTVQSPTMSAVTVSEAGYDVYGNVTTSTSARGNSTTIKYDDGYKLYPVQVTNAAGHITKFDVYGFKNAANSLVAVDGFQKQPGLLKQVTDPNNVITKYEYDPFGRLHTVYDGIGGFTGFGNSTINDGDPLKRYHYWDSTWGGNSIVSPFAVTERTRPTTYPDPPTSTTDSLSVVTRYDGFGRPIQERQRGVKVDATKRDVVVVTDYNALGQAACVSMPLDITIDNNFYSTKCSSFGEKTTTTYDALGRVDVVTPPAGSGSKTDYNNVVVEWTVNGTAVILRVEQVIDAAGHKINRGYNSRGELVQVREYTGTSSYTEYAQTTYTYDTLGNLTEVKNGLNQPTTMSYDALGRKTGMTDPDMGSWVYKYDQGSSLVKEQKDANGKQLCFSYDALDRLLVRAEDITSTTACPSSLPNSGATTLATYVYDSAANGKGQLATVSWGATPAQNSDTFFYDTFGRPYKQTRLIDGRSYSLETTGFDLLNRPLTLKYPTNEIVTLTYDREGENTLQAGSDNLVLGLSYNVRGQMLKLDRAGSAADTTYAYYGATGSTGNNSYRLQTMTHGSGSDVWPDMAYTYDKLGNILTLNTTTNGSSDSQSFGYDDLSRLTTAAATGAASYSVAYAYNEIGNITSFEGSSYGYSDATHKHAVTHIGGVQKFWYDANGNMTQRIEGSVTYTQQFDVENRLVSATPSGGTATTFAYDASGQRVKSVEPGGKTTYFPFPNYEETVVGASTIKRSSYALAGQVVAFRVAGDPVSTNNGLFFIYGDHLGSTTMLGTSSGGMVAGSLARYKPYGSYRTTPTQTLTDLDFTGQKENREVGLVYYNARFYVPLIGRFLSADTLVPSPASPQSFNRYSYVLNSPLNYSDPSGHDAMWCNDPSSENAGCNVPITQQVRQGQNVYGIIFAADSGETWTEAQMVTALKGAADVDRRLRAVGSGQTGFGNAFQQTYDSLTLLRSAKTTWTDGDGVSHEIDYGAQTFGRRIEFYDDAVGVSPLDPNFRYNVVHELGHAFNYVTNQNTDADPYATLGNALENALPSRETLRDGMNPYPLQQNTRATRNENYELFGDGFLNWTYNSFNNTTAGTTTSAWFETQMALWVSPTAP